MNDTRLTAASTDDMGLSAHRTIARAIADFVFYLDQRMLNARVGTIAMAPPSSPAATFFRVNQRVRLCHSRLLTAIY